MKLLSTLLVCCFPLIAFAQISGESRTFTLDECLKIASEKNYDIRTSLGQYQTQSAVVTQSFGTFLPQIGASMGYSRQLNTEGGRTVNIGGQIVSIGGQPPNSYSMSAWTQYTLFNGFARESNYSKAQRELDAAELTLRRARQTVSYTVRSQYLAVLKASQITKIRRENLELGRKEVERMKALFDAGRVPIANVYSQEADLGSREYDVVSAENAENQAKAILLSTLTLPPDVRAEFLESSFGIAVDESAVGDFRKEIGSFNAATAGALQSRADYIASTTRTESAQNMLSATRGGFFPSLSASGGWSWSNTSFDGFSDNGRYYVGMSLNIPIFDNFNTSANVQAATIQLNQREIDRLQAEQKVRSDVQSAFFNLDATEKQMEITKRAVRSATQNYDAIKERLNVGAATVLELQTANNQLINAKINRVTAIYSYFDAQAQMRNALGTLKDN